MDLQDLKQLPEGTQLRTTKKEIVTLAGFVRSVVIVRHADGGTREYRSVSLHHVTDVHPLITRERAGLTGHTVTVERVGRDAARQFAGTVPNWEGLIGRLAVVERTDGRLGKVCDVAGVNGLGDGEDDVVFAASSVACAYGARYVPTGTLT
ncbi:hypothetical protein [Actinomadura litoris]|uniref:Uncharacterized protein n=1 Tax=Actinomadura litoris TaxID=2678616 RepID=A0A7K1LB92_9ACTN|nr:hypothetical protein [Actinomadura litoris]MUN41455.1 hypothetical protein [Actinomadura litoris]